MNITLYKDYAEVERMIKNLEKRKSDLKQQIFDEMQKNKLDNLQSDYGTFYVTKRKSWKYSEQITLAEQMLKDQKKTEEQSGIAESVESESLSFRPKVEK